MINDNVGSLFAPDPNAPRGAALRQGVLQAWNPDTGENQVSVAGGVLVNIPVLTSESGSLAVGDVVSLSTDGTQWRLDGKLTTPGDPGTVPTWNADISALDENVTTINTVTIPGVQADVLTAQTTADTAQSTATSAASDASAALSTANDAAADAAAAAADALAAAGDAATALAKFPVTETDISDNAISAPKIAANAIDGLVITGALVRSAAAGQRVEVTTAGLVAYDANEVPVVVLPTDSGANPSFKGDIEAAGLTVTGGAVFYGPNNELASDAVWMLQSGVTAPKSAPIVTIDWPSIPWWLSRYGLQSDSTNWLTILDGVVPSIDTYSKATGALQSSISLSGFGSNGIRPWGGITKISSNYYTLSYVVSTASYLIHKLDSSGASLLSVSYTPIAGNNGSGGSVSQAIAPASIGTDGTNILIAEYDSANTRYRIQTRSTTTLSVTATTNTNLAGGGPVVGVMGGSSFDFGATRFVIATRTNGLYTFNTSGSLQASEIIPAPAAEATGVGWDGSNFYTAARNGGNPRVFKHTAQQYTAAARFATYTWYDADATGGTHETTMSPAAQFVPPSRSRVTLTGATIPDNGGTDDPDTIRFYIGTSAARTDQWRQTSPSAGVTSKAYETIATSGNNPPSSNNFPNAAAPAQIQNPAGTLVISGDGSIDADSITQNGVPVVTTTGVQTLTNKDLSSSTNTFVGKMMTDIESAQCSATATLTTSDADVTGATVTVTTLRANATYVAFGAFYFGASPGGGGVASGKLNVDGTTNTSQFANFTGATTLDRATVAQTWVGTLASAGSHTLKLRASATAGGTYSVNSGHTTITVQIFE